MTSYVEDEKKNKKNEQNFVAITMRNDSNDPKQWLQQNPNGSSLWNKEKDTIFNNRVEHSFHKHLIQEKKRKTKNTHAHRTNIYYQVT